MFFASDHDGVDEVGNDKPVDKRRYRTVEEAQKLFYLFQMQAEQGKQDDGDGCQENVQSDL